MIPALRDFSFPKLSVWWVSSAGIKVHKYRDHSFCSVSHSWAQGCGEVLTTSCPQPTLLAQGLSSSRAWGPPWIHAATPHGYQDWGGLGGIFCNSNLMSQRGRAEQGLRTLGCGHWFPQLTVVGKGGLVTWEEGVRQLRWNIQPPVQLGLLARKLYSPRYVGTLAALEGDSGTQLQLSLREGMRVQGGQNGSFYMKSLLQCVD